ncbi:MAG: UDP-N-acetyl glucosamine 2-epimerase, partial [Candidatus Hodarchaeota archaeon]
MNRNLHLILVAGARPNFVKIAPLIRAIEKQNRSLAWSRTRIQYLLLHTGQHYDVEMSEAFFRGLELPKPDINLEVGSASHAVQTARIMARFEKVCLREWPEWVIVVGDVNSTMACSLVAAKLGIRIAHVEAGLRSFDRSMPEEINRIVTDTLADLLFTPSEDADKNLQKQGIPPEKIKRVGNIMIDTLLANLDKARRNRPYNKFGLKEKNYAFVTLHRPPNVD